MKAVALIPGTTELDLVDRPEPQITKPDDVKLQVLAVGICGTDREEAAGGRSAAPPGERELIIGHEMLGRVVDVGSVWEGDDIAERELFNGHASGSARPLVWAHAEYVKLLRSLKDKRVFDTPKQTVKRYQVEGETSQLALWRFNLKCRNVSVGKLLRIEVLAPAIVHWTTDPGEAPTICRRPTLASESTSSIFRRTASRPALV